MSGGVIKQYDAKTLVKAKKEDGTVAWFSCVFPVFEGDTVVASGAKWTVQLVQNAVTANASPVPFHTLKEVDEVLFGD